MVYLQRWHGWCHMKLLPSRRVLRTPYNHAPCHFMQSHIRKVHACLAVTCHLHFWQNDRGLLRATAVTRGWNGYRNKSQRRKLTPEKKILPPLMLHMPYQQCVVAQAKPMKSAVSSVIIRDPVLKRQRPTELCSCMCGSATPRLPLS